MTGDVAYRRLCRLSELLAIAGVIEDPTLTAPILLPALADALEWDEALWWAPPEGSGPTIGLRVVGAWRAEGLASTLVDREGRRALEAWRTGAHAWIEAAPTTVLVPVADGVGVCGVLELAVRDVRRPAPLLVEGLSKLSRALGAALARGRDAAVQRHRERMNEATLRRLHDSGLVAIHVSEMQGAVREANDAYLGLIGRTRQDLEEGKLRWPEITPARWREADARAFVQIQARGVADVYEKEYLHADGHTVPVLVGVARLDPSSTECVCFAIDDSQRKHAQAELERLNASLEQRVLERTESLGESRRQLRALALRLETYREEDRTALAREIHDVLGQELTGLKLDAAWMLRRLDRSEPDLVAVLGDRLRVMIAHIEASIGSVRRIATELRPGVLDDLGLDAALRWHAQQFQARSGIAVDLELGPHAVADRESSTGLFRVFQELLTNVARHSGATHVQASLARVGGAHMLVVDDDGRGITAAEVAGATSLGLLGVRERIEALGGTFAIGPHDPRGTRAQVSLPIRSSGTGA